jgi:hypothetical protein
MGSTLESSRIVKDMAVSLGGSARASIWFDKAGGLCRPGQCGDERRRRLR